jgi:hypothetical protein
MADHPVKLPPDLFTEWLNEAMEKTSLNAKPGTVAAMMADRAAQWGWDQREHEVQEQADRELEACIQPLDINGCPGKWIDMLRATRRPKPPSLAEQGMEALRSTPCTEQRHYNTIRAALNRLAELEAQQ